MEYAVAASVLNSFSCLIDNAHSHCSTCCRDEVKIFTALFTMAHSCTLIRLLSCLQFAYYTCLQIIRWLSGLPAVQSSLSDLQQFSSSLSSSLGSLCYYRKLNMTSYGRVLWITCSPGINAFFLSLLSLPPSPLTLSSPCMRPLGTRYSSASSSRFVISGS